MRTAIFERKQLALFRPDKDDRVTGELNRKCFARFEFARARNRIPKVRVESSFTDIAMAGGLADSR